MEFLNGGVVGGMVSRALGSLLRFVEFLMRDSETCFEMRPGLVGWVASTPNLAVVGKHAGFEDEVVGGSDHLLLLIRVVGCGRDVHGIVNIFDKDFHWLIHVKIGAHPLVIFL